MRVLKGPGLTTCGHNAMSSSYIFLRELYCNYRLSLLGFQRPSKNLSRMCRRPQVFVVYTGLSTWKERLASFFLIPYFHSFLPYFHIHFTYIIELFDQKDYSSWSSCVRGVRCSEGPEETRATPVFRLAEAFQQLSIYDEAYLPI